VESSAVAWEPQLHAKKVVSGQSPSELSVDHLSDAKLTVVDNKKAPAEAEA